MDYRCIGKEGKVIFVFLWVILWKNIYLHFVKAEIKNSLVCQSFVVTVITVIQLFTLGDGIFVTGCTRHITKW